MRATSSARIMATGATAAESFPITRNLPGNVRNVRELEENPYPPLDTADIRGYSPSVGLNGSADNQPRKGFAMYAIAYEVGSRKFWKSGFSSIMEAERFRITKTSAFTWTFYKLVNGEFRPVLNSGAEVVGR
jgi:hypothetical protein